MTENETAVEVPLYKDLLAQMGDVDTLFGSLSYNDTDNVDGRTQPLRTSARVFKKMKFDLSNSVSQEKKIEKKDEVKQEDVKVEIKKPSNPLWSTEEKCIFFEALNEYGKDFESIHGHFNTRLKKRGFAEDTIKNKHQVRHFYYKSFNLIRNYLKFDEDIPRNALELYALINYGEIRKKLGYVTNKKFWNKLNELIQHGFCKVRLKGKTIKVKTPMCRALRRLNQLDEKYDDLKLPTRVIVELKPKDMVAFLKVQTMAQNPRIRVALALQKRLSSLITCISQRWKTSEAVAYDKALISTNPHTKDYVPDQKEIDANSILLSPLLRLTPPDDAKVELPSIDISEYYTGQSICLNAYEIRRGVKMKDEVKKEDIGVSNIKIELSENCETEIAEDTTNSHPDSLANVSPNQQSQDSQNKSDSNISVIVSIKQPIKEISPEERRVRIEEIRQGWTTENCASLTIGEMYLMFGSNSKLCLEYTWDSLKGEEEEQQLENENVKQTPQESLLTASLKKLLSIAKMKIDSNTNVMKCSCGHVCGSKTNTVFKKPSSSKVVKKNQGSHENNFEDRIDDCDANSRFLIDPKTNAEGPNFHETNKSMAHLLHQHDTFQKLSPKMRARGRGRYKQFVVERKLVPNKSETQHQLVSMNIVSQENKPSGDSLSQSDSGGLSDSESISSRLLSGTNDSGREEIANPCFGDLLGENRSSSVMSTGISKILNESENQWLNSDVTDFSLSSLLGHLDQSKTNQSMVSISNLSQDVDAQLQTLLAESSVDYTAQFADLAAKVTDNKK